MPGWPRDQSSRRAFIGTGGLLCGAAIGDAVPTNGTQVKGGVIDTHIHLFDPTRPEGVPWPPKDSSIYKSTLPSRLRELAGPLGVTGAIAIECSPWAADNQWLLRTAKTDPVIVGVVGDLEPGTPGFRQQLDLLQRNSLFRGIRYGNLWGRDLSKRVTDSAFVADLKVLGEARLVLDTANPTPSLMNAVVRLTDLIPDLTVVLDHLPGMQMPADRAAREQCEKDLRTLGSRPRVAAKMSGMLKRVGRKVPLDLASYRERMDATWATFGPERCLYGSDWPNSEQLAIYPEVFRLAREFILAKDVTAASKFYWTNAERVYGLETRANR